MSSTEKLIKLLEEIFGEIVLKIIVGLLVALISAIATWLWRKLSKARAQQKTIGILDGRIKQIEAAVSPQGKGIWLASAPAMKRPDDYLKNIRNSIPIITLAHLKGGVGKTTTAANLVAHYAIKKGERVLAIDLDFQGSLTAMTSSQADYESLLKAQQDGAPCLAEQLLDQADGKWLVEAACQVDKVPNAKHISAFYGLSATENRLMIEWLISKRQEDIRYNLSRVLHSEMVQRSFSRVIIDAPPRLTTACIQALCASTHVLVPTVLDELSAEAVGTFGQQLADHQVLWPKLQFIGFIGSMTEKQGKPQAYEVEAIRTISDGLAKHLRKADAPLGNQASVFPEQCFVPDKTDLSRAAGERIAYAQDGDNAKLREIRVIYDALGDEIDRRIQNGRKHVV